MASTIGMATSGKMCLLSRSTGCQKALSPKPQQIRMSASSFLGARPQTISSRVPRRRTSPAVVASSSEGLKWELEGQGLDSGNDYSGFLAAVGFAATYLYSRFTVSPALFLQTVAVLQLVVAVVSIVTRKFEFDRVAVVVGPATLAVYVLGFANVTFLQAATGLFGYYLAEHLEGPTTVPFWVWGAILVAAIYAGYGTEAYVAGWGLLAAARLVNGVRNKVVPTLGLPVLAASIYALAKDATLTLTLLFFLGQVVWSGVKVVDILTTRATK